MLDLGHTMQMMRRLDRQQDEEFARRIIAESPYGVISMVDDQGLPYAIPISHTLSGDTIFIHGAAEGTKLRILEKHNRVVFTCIGRTHILPDQFSTEYESAIVQGLAKIVTDPIEKERGLLEIARKYSPGYAEEAKAYVDRALEHTSLIAITILSITGKAKLPKA